MTSADLTFNPVLPGWMLALLAAAGLSIVLVSYRRSGIFTENRLLGVALAALKALALLGLLLMLAKPEWVRQEVRKEKADLIILVDFSESMNIRDERGDRTRFETARNLVGESWYSKLGEDFQLKLFGFSSFLRPLGEQQLLAQQRADGGSTDIGGSLQQAVKAQSGVSPAAVILLSDGVHNSGRHPAEVARQLAAQKVPVFAVGLGGEQKYVDVELNDVSVPETVFEKEQVTLGVDLTAYGYEGQKVLVRLLRRGITELGVRLAAGKASAEQLEEREIALLGQGFRQRVEFSYRPEAVGDHHLTLEIDLLPAEAVQVNNRSEVVLSVIKRQLRVLVIEGPPRWGAGMIFRVLRTDPRFRVDSLTLVNTEDEVFLPIGPGFADPEMWGAKPSDRIYPLDPPYAAYDCVILGDVDPRLFKAGSLDRLAERVRADGLALVFLAGEKTFHTAGWGASPLETLIPVILEPAPVYQEMPTAFMPTGEGLLHPLLDLTQRPNLNTQLWQSLPPGLGFCAVQQPRAGAMKLAQHPQAKNRYGNYPLLVFQRVGKGRVTALMTRDSWLWALAPDEQVRKYGVFARFWRGAIRYLISGQGEQDAQGIQLQLERQKIARGETLEVRAKTFGFEKLEGTRVVFELTGPDGLTEEYPAVVEPLGGPNTGRVYTAQLRPNQVGEYKVAARLFEKLEPVADDREIFTVEATAFEHRNAGLNAQLLDALAKETGGKYYDSGSVDRLLGDLPSSERTVTVTRKMELWNSLGLFLAVVAAIGAEWALRKWKDLS